MSMYKKIISVILLLGMVGSAFADSDWTNGGGDRRWDNAANWDPNVPTGADKAAIRASIAGPIIDSSTSAVANVIVCGDWGSTDSIDITGGTLTTGGWFILGYANGDDGTFNVSGGTTSVGSHLDVGRAGAGHMNMTAGTVTVSSTFGIATSGGSGDVQLDGGTISCGLFSMQTGATMDIGGGTLIVNGDVTSTINTYISNGWLTAYGDAGTLDVDYNNTNPGKTTITAMSTETDPPTPNPATFASVPVAISDTAITMTATEGSDLNGPVEYYFDEVTGNAGGTDSGWITSNSYTDTGLTGNTTYTYTVTMRDLFGNEGTASGGESATTWAATTTTIVWNPAGNGIYPPATGDWGDSGNWTTSVAGRPDGNFKAVFNVTNAAEAVVSGPQALKDIVQGNGGPGGVIRVVDGGMLTTIGGWMSIGYNNTATLIVEEGGVCDFGGHLWWGMQNTGVGTIEINGGTIIGRANVGLGWFNGSQNGVAHCYVNSGLLSLDHWSATESIHDGSVLDIELGSVTIGGDRTVDVAGYVAAGKITAYGGAGRVIYDYNATNPGKTTIQAIEGVDSDIDGDNDADIDDLFLFVQEWLSDLPIDGAGAVAYWRLDEATGAVAADDSANGYDGTLVNMDDSDWVDGVSGNALDFDGVEDYVEISGYKGVTGTAGRTCAAWIKTTQSTTGEFITWGSVDFDGAKWSVGIKANVLSLRVKGGSISGSTTINDGEWHHVAVTWEPDTDNMVSNAKLYVDGGVPETVGGLDDVAIGTAASENVHIGDFRSANYFQGRIDDVRIYDRALSETEIARLDSDCESEANFDEWCIIDFRDFAILASNWMSGNVTYWHVASTIYPTDDIIVTPHYAENFGIVGDGVTDVTDAIQDALISVSNLGGGALFLPAGNYKVSGNLTIPARVTLRGDWQKPVIGSPIAGTILQAYAGRDDENAAPFIELSGSSGVKGITIWYPDQLPTDIRPYPPTIHGGGATVENVTFVNSYFGFTTYVEGTTARPFMRHIYGTPLKTGIEYDCLADIGRIETVHFSPDYWADSGLANAPTAGQHETWIYNNGTGMIVRRIDWSYSCYVTVEGYNIGFALRPGRYDGKHSNGQSYMFTLTDCETGIYVEANSYAGYQFTRFDIQGAQTGVYMSNSYDEATMFHTCSINASGDAVYNQGMAKALMMSCDIQQGTLDFDGGYLSVINSNFTSTTTNHIELASGVHGASILGNSFAGGARISDSTSYPVNIDHTPLAVDALPAYDYKKPETGFKPAKDDLYVVTKSPYNAQADGVTDDAAVFQAALADADVNGGGIVFVPGGNYRLDGNLTVPTGVELKGVFDVSHGTRDKGSLLNVYAGRNSAGGTPFIQIESGAGIRGLSFHYPEQNFDPCDTVNYGMVPYPYMIRGLGSDVYAINLAATIPYQLLDLATYRCDRHYVDYIYSTALKTGIHVSNGSEDGQIHNCQFNPSAYTHQGLYYDSIPTGTSDEIHTILWRDATPYLFGNMSGEVLHENFVFGGMKGLHLVEDGGFGPSGYCLGMGVDQCTNAFQIDDIGSGGLDLINSQIVTVNATAGHYLDTGASLNDTFRMFSSAGWGSHQYSAVINGGDVKLQLFHLARDGETGAFSVLNDASLQNLGGNLTDYLALGRPFLTIDATATAAFIGNIINTPSSQMPTNTFNVTSIGNLRVQ